MSQLPPFSRPGTVRAASAAIRSHSGSLPALAAQCPNLPSIAPLGLGSVASGRVAITEQSVFCAGVPSSATSARSRSFHMARSSAEGAVPMRPGWMSPAKRTPGRCREQQCTPSKSQQALVACG